MDFLYVSMEEMQRKAMLYLNFHNVFFTIFYYLSKQWFCHEKNSMLGLLEGPRTGFTFCGYYVKMLLFCKFSASLY